MHRIFVVALMAALGVVVSAQSPPQETNGAILDELRQIRQLLEKLTRPPEPAPHPDANRRIELPVPTGYAIGQADAPLTIVEFTDLECPFCRHFHATTFEQLKTAYIGTHKLRYISRDFPLEALHPLAMTAARAARCAGEQGRFWEMRHAILRNTALTGDLFLSQAEILKLDRARFSSCLSDTNMFQKEIRQDMADADHLGVTGTPSFIIGRTAENTLRGVLVVGAQSFEVFDAELKKLETGN